MGGGILIFYYFVYSLHLLLNGYFHYLLVFTCRHYLGLTAFLYIYSSILQ